MIKTTWGVALLGNATPLVRSRKVRVSKDEQKETVALALFVSGGAELTAAMVKNAVEMVSFNCCPAAYVPAEHLFPAQCLVWQNVNNLA